MNLVNMGNKILFLCVSLLAYVNFLRQGGLTCLLYGQYGSSAKYGGYFSW